MTPGLAALLQPHPVATLHDHLRRDEPLLVHAPPGALRALRDLPLLASLEALLGAWPDQVQAHLPDVRDEASSVAVSPHDARKLFASGMGLLFDEAQRYAPALRPWLDAIVADLGLSALTQRRCLVYATPAGRGTAPHFDHNVNVVLQLHGTKTWWLARNDHVQRPMSRHTMGQPVDPELAAYASAPMPEAMPADRCELTLTAGSVLVVPRGTWHATHAASDALALNFTLTPPTWIDLFTAALRTRLAQSPEWRETAAATSVAHFERLVRELAADAPHWTAAEILAATEGEP